MTPLSLASPMAGARIYMALAPVDMRKGFDGLSMVVQDILQKDPFRGHVFIFRGKRADLIKILMWDGTGLCLFAKRLERGRFVWAVTQDGEVVLTPAQAGRDRLALAPAHGSATAGRVKCFVA